MADKKQFPKGKMVPVPSVSIIPERDVDKTPILECSHLGIDFGGLTAVNEFNITVGRTEIAGLIGPNGAGKTTVFNLLTKVYQPTRGTILLDGLDTHGKTPAQINRMGIARTFQNIRLFSSLSVEDNVKIGLHNQEKYSMFSGILRLPKYWRQEKAAHERALELLSIFDMQDMAGYQAGSLPYGAQRRLEIVRALATNPSLLLLDEPAAGMNPSETAELMNNIRNQFTLLTDVAELRRTLKTVAAVDPKGRVKLAFDGGKITFSCKGELGEACQELETAPLTGTPQGGYWYLISDLMACLRSLSGTATLGIAQAGMLDLSTEGAYYMQTAMREPVAAPVVVQKAPKAEPKKAEKKAKPSKAKAKTAKKAA